MKFYSEKAAGLFLFLQGTAGFIWWIILTLDEDFRKVFSLYPNYPESIYSFAIPDLLIFCIGSIVCSYGIFLRKKWLVKIIYFLSGGIVYVSLFCINHYLATGFAGISAVLMSLSALATLFISTIYIQIGRF